MIFNPNTMPRSNGGAIVGSYVGDGKTSRTFDFGVEPAAVFISSGNTASSGTMQENHGFFVSGANAGTVHKDYTTCYVCALTWGGTTMKIQTGNTSAAACLNNAKQTYHYCVIPKA